MKELAEHRKVLLRFVFTRTNLPAVLFARERQRKQAAGPRVQGVEGIEIVAPKVNVSVTRFVFELNKAGFRLVDVYSEREDPTSDRWIAYFVFAHPAHVNEEVRSKFDAAPFVSILNRITTEAMWTVRAYSNPVVENGAVVEGARQMCILMGGRQPFFVKGGERAKARPAGSGPDATPVPIVPSCRLRAENGVVALTD